MSKDLGASDENLIRKSDDEDEKKVSFFDNTFDESENDISIDSSLKLGTILKNIPEEVQSDSDKHVFTTVSKSFMEIEVKKDKQRWLYMSELGGIFGEEKHTREGFIKIFGNRVSCEAKIFSG